MSLRRLPAGAISAASKKKKQSRRHAARHGGGASASTSVSVSASASSSSMSSPSSMETLDDNTDDDEYFGDVDLDEFVRTIPSMTTSLSSSSSSTATSRRQGSNSHTTSSPGMTKRVGGKASGSGFGTATWSKKALFSVLFLVVGSSLVLLRDRYVVGRSIMIIDSNSSSFLRKSEVETTTKAAAFSSSSGTMTQVSISITTDDPQEKNGAQAVNADAEKEQQQQQKTTATTAATETGTASTTQSPPPPTTTTTTTTKRPYLLLHVGPQKTGSSTLQSAWDIMATTLEEQDNYHVEHITPEHGDFECDVGPWGGFRDCKAGKVLKDTVATAHSKGQNLILSDENLDQRFVGPLRDLIDESMWQVKVVVVYRRIYEWLVSWYNQINKTTNVDSEGKVLIDEQGNPYREEHKRWPDEGGVNVKTFTDWYKEYIQYWQPTELISKHRSVEFYNLYESTFPNVVTIYNMNQVPSGNFVTDFMCNVVENATQSCTALQNNEIELPTVNPSVKLGHDILAVAAYKAGLVDRTLSRQDVVAAISKYVDDNHVLFPIECNDEVVDQIRDWFFGSEAVMFPDEWSGSKREELFGVFDSFVAKGKLCDIDVSKTLEDKNWKDFFRSLGNGVEEELVESVDENTEKEVEEDIGEKTNTIDEESIGDVAVDGEPQGNDTESHSESNLTDNRLNLVLHVGPIKTGSTALQRFLMGWLTEDLLHDSYTFRRVNPRFGDFDCNVIDGDFRHCQATEKFKGFLSYSAETRQNVIISDENLDERYIDTLVDAIDTNIWKVTVVVVYRRLPEWLYSVYNEDQKTTNLDQNGNILMQPNGSLYRMSHKYWPGQGGKAVMQFQNWLSEYSASRDEDVSKIHNAVKLFNLYTSRFEEVRVLDFHEDGSLEEKFVCDYIPGATNSCKAIREDEKHAPSLNGSVNLDSEILAVEAYEKNLVDKSLRRQDVVGRVGERLAGMELLRICDSNLTKKLYEWLVASEKQLFGEVLPAKRIGVLNKDFEELLKKGHLCHVHVEKIFNDQDQSSSW
eukprot:CAMPEP_0113470346 /NCGR_PEP_ID=MMETSP0014_2-20120614/16393_1 /TAXON_ID=2857 /ORGANISM="Nitzschia sp." /LENGTH=1026 /DNA_ID=CAMNT_0000362903 /DNA_START=63 /DNA_END=3140 /DNA_ORIENTATION=- /assembly_acc=CAM_ASM_000159